MADVEVAKLVATLGVDDKNLSSDLETARKALRQVEGQMKDLDGALRKGVLGWQEHVAATQAYSAATSALSTKIDELIAKQARLATARAAKAPPIEPYEMVATGADVADRFRPGATKPIRVKVEVDAESAAASIDRLPAQLGPRIDAVMQRLQAQMTKNRLEFSTLNPTDDGPRIAQLAAQQAVLEKKLQAVAVAAGRQAAAVAGIAGPAEQASAATQRLVQALMGAGSAKDRDAIASRALAQSTTQVGVGMGGMTVATTNAGNAAGVSMRRFQQWGYILDDLQYVGVNGMGLRPVINNLMYINPLLGVFGLAADQAFRHWDFLKDAVGDTGPWAEAMAFIEPMARQLGLLADAEDRAADATERRKKADAATVESVKNPEKERLGRIAADTIGAMGGGPAVRDKVAAALLKQAPGIGKGANPRAGEEAPKEVDALQGAMIVMGAGGGKKGLAALRAANADLAQKQARRMQAADAAARKQVEERADAIVAGAMAGDKQAFGQLEALHPGFKANVPLHIPEAKEHAEEAGREMDAARARAEAHNAEVDRADKQRAAEAAKTFAAGALGTQELKRPGSVTQGDVKAGLIARGASEEKATELAEAVFAAFKKAIGEAVSKEAGKEFGAPAAGGRVVLPGGVMGAPAAAPPGPEAQARVRLVADREDAARRAQQAEADRAQRHAQEAIPGLDKRAQGDIAGRILQGQSPEAAAAAAARAIEAALKLKGFAPAEAKLAAGEEAKDAARAVREKVAEGAAQPPEEAQRKASETISGGLRAFQSSIQGGVGGGDAPKRTADGVAKLVELAQKAEQERRNGVGAPVLGGGGFGNN